MPTPLTFLTEPRIFIFDNVCLSCVDDEYAFVSQAWHFSQRARSKYLNSDCMAYKANII